MLAYIKAQTENPKFPESGFTLDKIMHLYMNFHRLVLTRDSSYTELSKWLKSKKAVINPQNKDEECFKWAVMSSGWCVHSTFAYGDVPDPLKMYRGKDCLEKSVEHIEKEVKRLYEIFPQQPMTRLTDVQKREHEAAEKCHICLKEFNDPRKRKVRDHCHYNGLYRGAAYSNCNMKYLIPDYIPIVFYNLSGYNAHLFIKELRKRFNKNDISVIAENKENYISFNVKINVKLAGVKYKDGTQVHKNIQLRFIDSCRFMASSLDKLASNLCGTSGIQCDKCKGNMELINIPRDYIALLGCERCITKKTKVLDEGALKKNFNHTSRF